MRLASGAAETVRYIGIDTPETVHPSQPVEYMGKEASIYNARLLQSGPLRLVTDVDERDKYGRLLAYVWAGDIFVNRRMVLDGFAQVSTYPPNVRYETDFLDAQVKARTAEVGLWAPATNTTKPPASVTTQPPRPSNSGGGEVYVTNIGEKYHTGSCRYLAKSRIPISLADAKAQGYDACKVCRPPQ